MFKKLLLTAFSVACINGAAVYAQDFYWAQTTPDVINNNDLITGMDQNMYVTGYGIIAAGYDSDGTPIWTLPANADFMGLGIAQDKDSNIYVTGNLNDTITLNGTKLTTNGYGDMLLVKLSPQGDVLWARLGGSADYDLGTRLIAHPDGGVIVGGLIFDDASFDGKNVECKGESDIFIARYTADGDASWATSCGGAALDNVLDMDWDQQQEKVILAGIYRGNGNCGTFPLPPSLEAAGFLTWIDAETGNFTALRPQSELIPSRIATTADNGLVVAYWFKGTINYNNTDYTAKGITDLLLARLNSAGDVQWVHHIVGSYSESVSNMMLDAKGNLLLSGQYRDSLTLSDEFQFFTAGETDIFLALYSPAGVLQSAVTIGGPGTDIAGAIAPGSEPEEFYIGGVIHQGNVPFGQLTLTGDSLGIGFLAKGFYDEVSGIRIKPAVHEPLAIFPQPARNECYIKLNTEKAGAATLEVYDLQGRLVMNESFHAPAGAATHRLDLGRLSKGLYVVKLQSGLGISTARLVVE